MANRTILEERALDADVFHILGGGMVSLRGSRIARALWRDTDGLCYRTELTCIGERVFVHVSGGLEELERTDQRERITGWWPDVDEASVVRRPKGAGVYLLVEPLP